MSQDLEVEVDAQGHDEDVKLENLTIQALRKYAALYRITLEKTATREQIIAIIKNKRSAVDMAVLVDETSTGPKAGWARINIYRDPIPGATNNPVYVGCNGYNVTIPRGVEVDVPIKVVGVLTDAVEKRLVENYQEPHTSNKRWTWEPVLSYPFSVIATNPGPDPRPGFEKGKAATMRPREKFRELFGKWPSNDELLQAQKEGFIKMNVLEMTAQPQT